MSELRRAITTEFSRVGNNVQFTRDLANVELNEFTKTGILTKIYPVEIDNEVFNARDGDQFVNINDNEHVVTGYESGAELA